MLLFLSPTGSVVTTAPSRTLFERLKSPNLVAELDAQRTPVVRLPNFLSADEQARLHEVARAVQREGVDHHSTKAIGGGKAWRTTFVNQRLPELLPDVWERVLGAIRSADAEHFRVLDEPSRHTLNLRSAEYHDIGPGGALPHPKHLDYGSLITVDFMLSDTDDFEGGTFSTLEADGTLQPRAFERGDMIIFLSHKYHCVAPVTAGRRNVLVCELWEGLPRICPQRCSDAFGPCYCRFAPPALVVGGAQTPIESEYRRIGRKGTAGSPHFVKVL